MQEFAGVKRVDPPKRKTIRNSHRLLSWRQGNGARACAVVENQASTVNMAAPRRVEVEVEEDMDDDELAVVNALLASQEETIHQQRQVIAMQKEKIRLLNQLVDRREAELDSSQAANSDEVVEELRREVSRLRSINQKLEKRQAPHHSSLKDELDSGSEDSDASAADDCKMAASDYKGRPSKMARSEE